MVLRRLLPAALVAVLVAAGACSSGGGDDDAASSSSSSTTTTTEVSTSEPAATTTTDVGGSTTEAERSTTTVADEDSTTTDEGSSTTTGDTGDLDPKSGEGAGSGTARLIDVRTGRHDGFDRIVLEFADEVRPGWSVEWVEGPITQSGSGNPVEVDGAAYLQIRAEPASGYDLEAGAATFAADRVAGPGGGPVPEVVRAGGFEANLIWVAGAAERTPFTVSTLGSPSRLVIDVAAA
ncbi:hypothetical protein BH24ACT4_BH24ACT4_20260 [soil metagenome]